MRLVADTCPGCGAKVQVDADADQAQCKYCSATFRLGDTSAAKVVAALREARSPPVQTRSPWLILAVIVVIGGIAAVVSLTRSGPPTPPPAPAERADAAPAIANAAAAEKKRPSWLPHRQALLVDVNGDGLRDPIGWARYYQSPGTPQHLVALDAATGKQVWQSDVFSPNDWSAVRVALVDELLVVADTAGLLRGIATTSGKTVWSTPLGERARRICRRTEGGLMINLDDDRAVEVTLATGSLTPRGKADRRELDCETLRSGEVGEDPAVLIESPSTLFGGRAELAGMDTSRVVLASDSSLAFAVGIKKPGSPVPTVAAFARPSALPERGTDASYEAVWKTAVAGSAPLAAAQASSVVAWFEGGRLFVTYTTTSTPAEAHLVALDGATGRGVYDVVLAGIDGARLSALTGADGRLYVTHSSGLDVYDAKDGKHLAHLSD